MNPTGWRALYFVWRKGAPRPEPMRFPPNPDGRGVVLDLGGGIRIIQDGPPVGKLKHHKDGAYGLLGEEGCGGRTQGHASSGDIDPGAS